MSSWVSDDSLDVQLRTFLGARAADITGMPSVDEVVAGIDRRGHGRAAARPTWALIALLATLAIVAGLALLAGARRASLVDPRAPANGWIVYSTKAHHANVPTGDLYAVRQGGAPHVLVADGTSNVCPSFSPDGTRLAYRSGSDLVVVEIDAGGYVAGPVMRRALPEVEFGPCPAWSPDARRIAAATATGLALVGLDGTETPVAVANATYSVNAPNSLTWSPKGDEIALTTEQGVVVADVDGAAARLLAPGSTSNVAWSPDGTRLAFEERTPLGHDAPPGGPQESGPAVHVIGIDGQREVVVGDGADPVWSPTGREIAYLGDCQVTIAAADGTAERMAANGCYYSTGPWSPDGEWILQMRDQTGADWGLLASATGSTRTKPVVLMIPTHSSRNFPALHDVSWQPLLTQPVP